ncbi:hypothetical protein [Actinomadura sp. 9N215]
MVEFTVLQQGQDGDLSAIEETSANTAVSGGVLGCLVPESGGG